MINRVDIGEVDQKEVEPHGRTKIVQEMTYAICPAIGLGQAVTIGYPNGHKYKLIL